MGLVEQYIKSNLDRGYSRDKIFYALKEAGYDKERINEAFTSVLAKRPFPWRLFAMLSGVVIGTIVLFVVVNELVLPRVASLPVECTTKLCFLERARDCRSAVYDEVLVGSIVTYEVEGCMIKKSFKQFSASEPQAIRDFFSGQEMRCNYTKETFDISLADGLLESLNRCEGPLKDAIMQIQAT